MLGLRTLLEAKQPGKPIILTVDGMIARAENRSMVDLIPIPLEPIERVVISPDDAVVMVDSQPGTGRRASEAVMPVAVLDHHETGGTLDGVQFRDIRDNLGATSTMVTGYLLEQQVGVSPKLATALLYGIDSEVSGYPRESTPLDDGALVWLFTRADKDLLARIKNPEALAGLFRHLPARLANAFLYRDVVVSWCGRPPARHHRRGGRLLHPIRPGQLGAVDRTLQGHPEALDPGRQPGWALRRGPPRGRRRPSAPPGATTSGPAGPSPSPIPRSRDDRRSPSA